VIYIVLPAWNEAANLPALLRNMKESLEEAGLTEYLVVVIDDGSTDGTAAVVTSLSPDLPVTLRENERNLGLAETLKRGLTWVVGLSRDDDDIIVTMDADNTHTPGLIFRMVQAVREGNDVVIASRYRYGARVRGVSASRRLLSLGASWLFRVVFPMWGVRDYTSGFRGYRAGLLRRAFQELGPDRIISERGFACMVDILLKLREFDPLVTEVPLILRYDQKKGASKMHVGRTVRETLYLMVRRRLRLKG
jgi:dolichol-phosphate mannosyltransferase